MSREAKQGKLQFGSATFQLLKRVIQATGLYHKSTGELSGMIPLDFRIKIVLKSHHIPGHSLLHAVTIQLRKVENDLVINLIAFHPFQLFVQEEAGVRDGTLPVSLPHKLPVFIDPEELFLLHESGDLLWIR
jgi:hypothetical protein